MLLIFLHGVKIMAPIESFIAAKSRPLLSRVYFLSFYLRSDYKQKANSTDWAGLARELRDEVNNLTAENAKLRILENENRILREHLDFANRSGFDLILANIIATGGLSEGANRSVIIDKGAGNGLKDGQIVLSSQGIVAGKIIAAKDNMAEVCLLNGPKCSFAVTVLNSDKTRGIVEGELGLTVKMKFIPQTDNIEKGDLIITSGLEPDIPRGLVIGKISEVEKGSNELWQSAVVEPLADLDDLSIVSVLLPK